ncbi:MAG: cytochrome-c peroxidase [Saprospiraceae bacterium]
MDLNNPLIDKRIELGKILFFDPILSNNIERSCASCHQPGKAFTDGQKKAGLTDRQGNVGRNSPTL